LSGRTLAETYGDGSVTKMFMKKELVLDYHKY